MIGRAPLRRLPSLLAALAVALAGLGAHFTVRAEALRVPESARNLALVDTAATAQARSASTKAVNTVLAYSADGLDTAGRKATEVLAGPAVEQYRTLLTVLRRRAPEQGLTLTTNVVDSAVLSLTARRARVLVFADQLSRGPGGQVHAAAAQLVVDAEKHGRRWVLTGLEPR